MNENKKNRTLKSFFVNNISGWILILPSVILFILLVWRPIVVGIGYSFFSLKGFTPQEFVGLKNFKDVLTDTNFLQTLWNTVQYVFWSLIIGFPLPFICAFMINEMVRGKAFFKFTMYLPVIIPSIAVSMIWKFVYLGGEGGLINMLIYKLGISPVDWLSNKNLVIPLIIVSMTWNSFGSTVILFLATMQGVNQELYDAARLDGAGFFGRINTVMMPYIKPTLMLMLIRQIIGVFNITEQPLAMTGGGPNGASMSIGLTNYFYAFKYGQNDKSLALGVIVFIILLALTLVYNRLDKGMD